MASIALSCIWGKEIPIETLDLFKEWPDEEVQDGGTMYLSKPSLNDDSDLMLAQNGFRILSSDNSGLLSSLIIQRLQSNLGKDRTMVILYALALNAFGVGYDCYNKKLHVTEEFIDFTHSRQLRIQSPVSVESLFLLLQYQRLFDCYTDLTEEIELIYGFRLYCDKLGLSQIYNNSISARDKLVLDELKPHLGPYFRLIEYEQPVLPGLEVQIGMQYQVAFRDGFTSDKFSDLDLPSINIKNLHFDAYTFTESYNNLMRKSTSSTLKSRFRIAMSYYSTACMVLLNPGCLNHDFAEKHVHVIQEFSGLHPFCMKALLSLNYSVIEMYRAIRKIQAYSRQYGNLIIGLLETHKRIDYRLEEISKESLDQLVETYRLNAGMPLVEQLVDLSKFEYKDRLRELTTTTELEIEGCRMNNCVGGYAARLQSDAGRTRIFHIDGPKPSTVALYFDEDSKGVSYEVAGISNRDVAEEHLIVAERLGGYLSNTIWSPFETGDSAQIQQVAIDE